MMRLMLGAFLLTGPAQDAVELKREEGRVVASLRGKPIATYVFDDKTILRPYFAHVAGPSGTPLTRAHPPAPGKDATDHATMHPGIWLGFGDLGGADFWRNKGRVEHVRFAAEPSGGSFAVVNRYVAGDRTVCEETCRVTFQSRPSGILLILDSSFASEAADFAFGDQEEMGLGIRVATPLTVKAGGRMADSEGRVNEAKIWGNEADWCDYGRVVGGRRAGLQIMPDPANFRRSWMHARDYGVLVANPFGRKSFGKGDPSRVVVRKGETFRLRFGVLLHDAPEADPFDPKAAYEDFLKQLK